MAQRQSPTVTVRCPVCGSRRDAALPRRSPATGSTAHHDTHGATTNGTDGATTNGTDGATTNGTDGRGGSAVRCAACGQPSTATDGTARNNGSKHR